MRLPSLRHLVAFFALATAGFGCRAILGVEERVDACEDYCTLVMKDCTGNNLQYLDVDTCVAFCKELPTGSKEGDTLECRLALARDIDKSGETLSCPGAGPLGYDSCGKPCEAYCAMLENICPDQYTSLGDCAAACKQVKDCGGYKADGTRTDATLQCRIYHLTVAASSSEHCQHAIGHGGPCAEPPTCP
jgi:hypothetical protein